MSDLRARMTRSSVVPTTSKSSTRCSRARLRSESAVTLTVVGFSGMQNLGAGNYTLNATGVGFPPDTVTIRSSLGGQTVVLVSSK